MASTRRFTFRLDSEGVEKLKRDLEALGSSGQRAFDGIAQSSPQLQNALRRAEGDVDRTRRGLEQLGSVGRVAGQQLNEGLVAAAGRLGPLGAGMVALGGSATLAAGAVGALAAAVYKLGTSADGLALMEARLKLVTGSALAARESFAGLFAAAQASGSDMGETVSAFQRLGLAARDIGAGNAEVVKLTDAMQKLGRLGGATGAELQSGMLQFAQAMASGRLQGDELRSIMENMPLLARAIADGLGVGVGQLREMGAAGELTAERVFPAILKQTGQINEDFARLPRTIEQSATAAVNAWSLAISRIGDRLGANDLLVALLRGATVSYEWMAEKAAAPSLDQQITALQTRLAQQSGTGGFADSHRAALNKRLDALVQQQEGEAFTAAMVDWDRALLATNRQNQALNDQRGLIQAVTQDYQNQAAQLALTEAARQRAEAFDKGSAAALKKAGYDSVEQVFEKNPPQVAAEIAAAATAAGNAAMALADGQRLLKEQEQSAKRLADETKKRAEILAKQYADEAAQQDKDRAAAQKRGDEILRQDAEREKKLAAGLEQLEREADLAGKTREEREVQLALMRLQEQAGRKLNDAEIERGANAVRTRQETERTTRETERAAAEWQRIQEREAQARARQIESATDRAVDKSADLFFDLFEGKIGSIGELLEQTLKRALAEGLAEATVRPLARSVMEQFVGLGGSSAQGMGQGMGQGRSLLPSVDSWFQGNFGFGGADNFAGQQPGAYGPFPASGGNQFSASGALGAGIGALATGYGVSRSTGNKTYGALAGAGSGALAGLQVAGPWGALAGGVAGLIGGLLGPGASVGANSGANSGLDMAGALSRGINSGADNGGNAAGVVDLLKQTSTALQSVLAATGGRLRGNTELGYASYSSGILATAYQDGRYLGGLANAGVGANADQAAASVLRAILSEGSQGLGANVLTAVRNSRATSLADLGSDIDFAQGFADAVAAMRDGALDFSASIAAATRTELAQAITNLRQFNERAAALGLDAEAAREATQQATLAFLGLGDAVGEKSKLQLALEALGVKAKGAGALLESVGLDPGRAGEVMTRGVASLRAELEQNAADRWQQRDDPLNYALRQLEDARRAELEDAARIGASIADIERYYGAERLRLIEESNAAQLAAAQAGAESIKQYLLGNAVADPSLTIAQRLAAAQAQFGAELNAARGGDSAALSGITRSAEALRQAAQDQYGTAGSDYAGLRDWLRSSLAGLVGGIPGFADGTLSAPGGLAMVGERGPELVNLPRGSQVFPADLSARLMAGGGDMAQVATLLRDMLATLRQMLAQQAITNDRLTGIERQLGIQTDETRRSAQILTLVKPNDRV